MITSPADRQAIAVRGPLGEKLTPGTIYFAPSDHHMMFGPSEIELSRGPRLHFVRPSVDMLFVSAAAAFGKRVAGVLLTGVGPMERMDLSPSKSRAGSRLFNARRKPPTQRCR